MSTGIPFMATPQVPARFEVRGELGRGGMAMVYHAYDLVGERDVALKFLPPTEDEQLKKRFQREAIDLASVYHPNVVDFYSLGESGGVEFIEMEYVDGGDLGRFSRDCDSLRALLEVFVQICEGLEHIHACGVVHRDIKPANILMTRDDQPKISDMGLARREQGRSQLTQDGALLGTASYLAPEQLMSHMVGPAADLYALGVCLFEAVTCQHPFHAEGPLAMLRAHLDEKPPLPSSVLPGIPERLDRLILGLMEKDPLNRPASAQAVLDELRLVLQELTPSQELLISTSPEGLLNRARLLLGDGAPEEALELLEHAELRAEDASLRARILCQKARAKVLLRDDEAGKLAVEAVAACRSGHIKYLGEALLVLGQAATAQGLFDEALLALQEARDLIPSSRRDLQVGLMDSLATLHEQGASMGHPSLSTDESKRFREIAQGLARRGDSQSLSPSGASASLARAVVGSSPAPSPIATSLANSMGASRIVPSAAVSRVSTDTPWEPKITFKPMGVSMFDSVAPSATSSPEIAPPSVVEPSSSKAGLYAGITAAVLLMLGGFAYSFWPARPAVLQVDVSPKSAMVMVDGTKYKSPFKSELKAGSHKVKVFQQGFKPYEEAVVLTAGQTLQLKANLIAASGGLKLASKPAGAKLFVNGQARGVTPAALEGLPPKKLKVKLVKDGYKPYEGSVDVLAGETKNLSFAMVKLPPPPPKPVARTYAPAPSYSSGSGYSSSGSSSSYGGTRSSGSRRSTSTYRPSSSSGRRTSGRSSFPQVRLPSRVEIRGGGVRVKFP